MKIRNLLAKLKAIIRVGSGDWLGIAINDIQIKMTIKINTQRPRELEWLRNQVQMALNTVNYALAQIENQNPATTIPDLKSGVAAKPNEKS